MPQPCGRPSLVHALGVALLLGEEPLGLAALEFGLDVQGLAAAVEHQGRRLAAVALGSRQVGFVEDALGHCGPDLRSRTGIPEGFLKEVLRLGPSPPLASSERPQTWAFQP